ncbi:MAG TPA: MBL fold metallo-hydrolase [Pyrinomonadaceae bacterium]|jgi:glyoxylase-like metal-dependent hydrolase (beta-lactamase superfamily II)|nr:MBL fold metallo-hydrolase [Pyrinomonadaceae bacterium]
MKKYLVLLAALIICLVAMRTSAQDFSKVEIKVIKVAGSVYMLQGAGGNIGVSVGPDGFFLVDDQYAELADKIKAALKTLGDGKVKYIVNTHYHLDHVGNNAAFGPEVTIIAHPNCRKRLETDQVSKFFNQTFKALPKEALPNLTYEQTISVFFNGEEIKIVHFANSHTDGDSVVFFPGSNVVHMGDNFFNPRFPIVDIEGGGNAENMAKHIGDIISRLQNAPGVKIIPGHGPLTDLDGLKAYHRMLVETIDIVRKRMAAGKTLDQIKAEGLPEEWKSWGSGFIKTDVWLTLVYNSLSAKH